MSAERHLTAEEISAWALGEASTEARGHVKDCAACNAEIALFGQTLSMFRTSVREWSDLQQGSDVQTLQRIRRAPYDAAIHRMSWIAVAALACLLLTFGVQREQQRQQQREAIAQEDATLLQELDQGVSRMIPSSMEPLTKLLSWDKTDGNQQSPGKAGTGSAAL